MTVPTLTAGHKFWLWYGGTAGSSYAKVCGLTATEINFSNSGMSAAVRDCADGADDTPVMVRKPGVQSWAISGTIQYNKAGYETLIAACVVAAGVPISDTHYWKVTSTLNGEAWSGRWFASALGLSAPADGQNFATNTLSLESDGTITFTPGA